MSYSLLFRWYDLCEGF